MMMAMVVDDGKRSCEERGPLSLPVYIQRGSFSPEVAVFQLPVVPLIHHIIV
jgi:hypothetical protein